MKIWYLRVVGNFKLNSGDFWMVYAQWQDKAMSYSEKLRYLN